MDDRPRLFLLAAPPGPRFRSAQRHPARGHALRPRAVRPLSDDRAGAPAAGRRDGARRAGRDSVHLYAHLDALRWRSGGRRASPRFRSPALSRSRT